MFFLLLEGFKDQVRWPKGPPHLHGPKPSLFVFFVFHAFFLVPFFAVHRKTLLSPQEKTFLLNFQCLPLFVVSLFASPKGIFYLISECLSLSLVYFLSSFLSLFIAFFWFLVFVSFNNFLSSLLLNHEKNNIKIYYYYKVLLFHQSIIFSGFLS